MKALPELVVVDASVGVKLFIEEEGSDRAEQIFARLEDASASPIAVPDLFFIECANVFRSRVKRRLMTAQAAREAAAALAALPVVPTPTANFVPDALDIALEIDVSVYDACYAALAATLEVPLITADRKLAAKLSKRKIRALILHEISA